MAPYYSAMMYTDPTLTDMARLTLPMGVARIMAVAATSVVAGSGTFTGIAWEARAGLLLIN